MKKVIEELEDLLSDMCIPTPEHLKAIETALTALKKYEDMEKEIVKSGVALGELQAELEKKEAEISRIRLGMGDDYGDDPVAVIDTLKAELERVKEALRLILPMAKGYAYKHQVGSNMKYIEIVKSALGKEE